MNKNPTQRFWEIDALRGVAIVMMVLVHLRYDLVYYGGYRTPLLVSAGWVNFARATASIFMFLVGVSLTLSFARATKVEPGDRQLFAKYLKRGLTVFGWGMVITVVTWVLLREGAVYFGILHFIGLSIILAYPFLRLRLPNLLIGLILIALYPFLRLRLPNLLIGLILVALGAYLNGRTFTFPWLMWLGLVPERLTSVDYYPLIPWFGVVLLGVFFGNLLYPGHARRFPFPNWSGVLPIRWLAFLGQHSLMIYVVHQPIIMAMLSLSGVINPGFM
jgi:uncharacterized membrane protein